MQLKQLEIVANLVSVAVTSFLQRSGGGNLLHDTESEARPSGRELEAETRRKLQGDESPFAGLLSVLLGGGSPEGDGELFLGAMTDAAKDCDIDFNEMIGKFASSNFSPASHTHTANKARRLWPWPCLGAWTRPKIASTRCWIM